ncbi:13612_t:CDS:1, partial [Gigaspora rosea]
MDDLDLKPIMAFFTYTTIYNEPDTPLLEIQNNNRFDIQVALNIPTNDFKNTFETPSLKLFNQTFDN